MAPEGLNTPGLTVACSLPATSPMLSAGAGRASLNQLMGGNTFQENRVAPAGSCGSREGREGEPGPDFCSVDRTCKGQETKLG